MEEEIRHLRELVQTLQKDRDELHAVLVEICTAANVDLDDDKPGLCVPGVIAALGPT
jgi:hypothetical protein